MCLLWQKKSRTVTLRLIWIPAMVPSSPTQKLTLQSLGHVPCTKIWLHTHAHKKSLSCSPKNKPQTVTPTATNTMKWFIKNHAQTQQCVFFLPTTIRVNSKPLLTDFLYTWFGRLAKPTYPSRFFCCCKTEKRNTYIKTIKIFNLAPLRELQRLKEKF